MKNEIEKQGKLNQIIVKTTKRANGSIRIQQDFDLCPSLAEQHSAHMSDINYLMEKYKPDELTAYIAARNQYRQEILGHDFSREPNLQTAKNIQLNMKRLYQNLPQEIQQQFGSPLDFLKFIDNPSNEEKLIKMGLMKKKEIAQFQAAATNDDAGGGQQQGTNTGNLPAPETPVPKAP